MDTILYQNGDHWVVKTGKSYYVVALRGVAGYVLDRIGVSFPDAFNRAKHCCDRREEQRLLQASFRK
jgi:hypothetical protein